MRSAKTLLGLLLLGAANLAGCAGQEIIKAGAPIRAAIQRNASFSGIEAKRFVGEPIEKAIERFGPAIQVGTTKRPEGTVVRGVDWHGKDIYLFERDRTNYTIDIARGSQTVQTGQGLVTVNEYERQDRVAICQVGFLVDPQTRVILDYELRGNCI